MSPAGLIVMQTHHLMADGTLRIERVKSSDQACGVPSPACRATNRIAASLCFFLASLIHSSSHLLFVLSCVVHLPLAQSG